MEQRREEIARIIERLHREMLELTHSQEGTLPTGEYLANYQAALENYLAAERHLLSVEDLLEQLRKGVLPDQSVQSTVHTMDTAHRVAISQARDHLGSAVDRKFLKSIRAAGYSLNSLAKAVGMSPSALSQARRNKTDAYSRGIRASKARHVNKLTKWPADDAHWPGGIIED